MRTYYKSLGTQLNILWWPKWKGNSKKEGIYAYVQLIHFAVQKKFTQHCKTTTLQ